MNYINDEYMMKLLKLILVKQVMEKWLSSNRAQ
jgi:hypothetical protein